MAGSPSLTPSRREFVLALDFKCLRWVEAEIETLRVHLDYLRSKAALRNARSRAQGRPAAAPGRTTIVETADSPTSACWTNDDGRR